MAPETAAGAARLGALSAAQERKLVSEMLSQMLG